MSNAQIARLMIAMSIGIASLMSSSRSFAQTSQSPSIVKGRASLSSGSKTAQEKESKTKFLRMERDEKGNPLTLQTALTRYKSEKGDLLIDLIGAVHIGEGDYYKQLNAQFKLYDVVLYELVAPEGTRIPKGGRKAGGGNPISMLQSSAQNMLGLESQLERVDYQAKNFVHADLSPTQMSEKMAERGDTALTIGLSAISEMMRQSNRAAKSAENNPMVQELSDGNIFELMGKPLKMKQMMATQFTSGGSLELGLGKSLNQLLIQDRNEAAMKVLQKQIVNGEKRIGIFYGAAHMPDFESRFVKELGLKKTKQVWVDAWDLTTAPKAADNDPASMMMKLLQQLGK